MELLYLLSKQRRRTPVLTTRNENVNDHFVEVLMKVDACKRNEFREKKFRFEVASRATLRVGTERGLIGLGGTLPADRDPEFLRPRTEGVGLKLWRRQKQNEQRHGASCANDSTRRPSADMREQESS